MDKHFFFVFFAVSYGQKQANVEFSMVMQPHEHCFRELLFRNIFYLQVNNLLHFFHLDNGLTT